MESEWVRASCLREPRIQCDSNVALVYPKVLSEAHSPYLFSLLFPGRAWCPSSLQSLAPGHGVHIWCPGWPLGSKRTRCSTAVSWPQDMNAPGPGHRKKTDPTPELHKVSLELGSFRAKMGKDTQTGRQVKLERKAVPSGHFWVSLHPERWLIHSANPAGICSAPSLLGGS